MQNMWQMDDQNYSDQIDNFASGHNQIDDGFSNYLGQKRSEPERMTNFGLPSRQFSGLRNHHDSYNLGVNLISGGTVRSGIRSMVGERYIESPMPKFNEELTYSTIKNLKTPDLNEYEEKKRRLKEKYEIESKMLMENIRNKAKQAKEQNLHIPVSNNNLVGGFKKPVAKKNPNRGAARPPVIKEGDWLCSNSNCSNINWSKRSSCNL
jgi:hypothetical protein